MVTSPKLISTPDMITLAQKRSFSKPMREINELPKTPLFGTDGIRGKVGELLNANFALQVGFWAGQVLKQERGQGTIIIGQDSRNSSDMLSSAIAAGLTSAGLEVWNLGLCPTPCVAHLTRTSEAIGGIMISASHNPPEDNGIKFFGQDGLKLTSDLTQQIEAGIRGNHSFMPSSNWGKHYQRPQLTTNYQEALVRSLPNQLNFQGMRVVLDLAWGAAVNIAPSVFEALGADVICLHDQANGDRINVNCGSTHLAQLQKAIKYYHADLGFGFDGDADRVIAVDSEGKIVDGDYILYLWGKQLQQSQKLPNNLLIATVMANLGFERAWQQLGGQMIRTNVGDQYVQAQMWASGAMLGGEQSGHILCHHHSYSGDGVQTALHLTALVRQADCSLAQLVNDSFQTYPQVLRNVRVENRDRRCHWQECEPLQRAITEAETAMGDQGRILVRASGTEPLIRVMVEASDAHMTDHWSQKLVTVVQQYLAN